jgi:hypothetical protein
MDSHDHDATKGNRYYGDQSHPEVSRLPIDVSQLPPGLSFDPQTSDSEIDENENEFLNHTVNETLPKTPPYGNLRHFSW